MDIIINASSDRFLYLCSHENKSKKKEANVCVLGVVWSCEHNKRFHILALLFYYFSHRNVWAALPSQSGQVYLKILVTWHFGAKSSETVEWLSLLPACKHTWTLAWGQICPTHHILSWVCLRASICQNKWYQWVREINGGGVNARNATSFNFSWIHFL